MGEQVRRRDVRRRFGAGSESPGRPPDLRLPAETDTAAIAAAAEPPAGRRAVLFQHDRHWAATGALCSAWKPLTALVDVIEKSSLLNQSKLTTRHGSDTSKGVPARLAGRVGPGDDRSDRCRGAVRSGLSAGGGVLFGRVVRSRRSREGAGGSASGARLRQDRVACTYRRLGALVSEH